MKTSAHHRAKNQSGQIVVEYILLLMIGVMIAGLITAQMVRRSDDPAQTGFLIRKWDAIIRAIGADYVDDLNPAPAEDK